VKHAKLPRLCNIYNKQLNAFGQKKEAKTSRKKIAKVIACQAK